MLSRGDKAVKMGIDMVEYQHVQPFKEDSLILGDFVRLKQKVIFGSLYCQLESYIFTVKGIL